MRITSSKKTTNLLFLFLAASPLISISSLITSISDTPEWIVFYVNEASIIFDRRKINFVLPIPASP